MGITTWRDCYNDQWGDELVPEAFSHPAKGAPGLSKRIYDHVVEEGWLSAGDIVLDPFGGVAGFGLQAMAHGLAWIGVELEQKFVDLGNQNISLWNRRYSRFANWGSAALLQGDSRNLLAVVEAGRVAGVVSSPPFAEAQTGGGISATMRGEGNYNLTTRLPGSVYQPSEHGVTPGNLGNLRATEVGFDAAIASPPYTGNGVGHDAGHPRLDEVEDTRRKSEGCARRPAYGHAPGQLGSMPAGDFDAAVSSPPYEVSMNSETSGIDWSKAHRENGKPRDMSIEPGQKNRPGAGAEMRFGLSEGQLGSEQGDDFWSAARIIVQQTYAALRPGGHAIWVVKAFVRNKQIVDFPGQWRRLCETCGFVTLHEHHAMLRVEQAQLLLDGGHTRKTRVSFFRRNHESKAMAAKFWMTLTREVKADCLHRAHKMAWKVYHKSDCERLPSKSKIIVAAQILAWKERGKPEIDVPVRIDFEVVFCQVKPMTLAEGRELAIEALEQAEVRRQEERAREAAWFADCAVSSLPFTGVTPSDQAAYGNTLGQFGNMKAKP